ncbi:MAG: NAD(P)-binding protein, partial [Akkermansiaceae bacterium]|nr:NAD(P)-binding protein [Akkermansiaceae bacterium]
MQIAGGARGEAGSHARTPDLPTRGPPNTEKSLAVRGHLSYEYRALHHCMAGKRVIVIGAGPGGLAAAGILANRGFDVTVLEKGDRVGGRNAELKLGDYSFDTGPTFLHQKFCLDEIFADMDRDSADYLDFVKLDPMTRLSWADGASLETSFDQEKMEGNIASVFPGEE